MENHKEWYILGYPIDTPIGRLHFAKVSEYTIFTKYINILNLQKFEVIKWIENVDEEFAEVLNTLPFVEIINKVEQLKLKEKFEELFLFCFKDDVFCNIKSDEDLENYRDLIRKVNGIRQEIKNPNPEIERFNRMKRAYNASKNGDITFESMFTSIWTFTGINPKSMTLYEFYALFARIGQFKHNEITTLYSSVSSEVKVEPWHKHVDLFQEEKKITLDEFSQKATGMTGN